MATSLKTRGRQGPLKRVGSTDLSSAEEVFKAAALLIEPEDQTQRQAFEKLMPHLYVLRNKGCSIHQLTGLLTQCGFDLQPSTVRDYFREGLAKRMDICQERMNEQIVLLAEVRKQTAGADLSEIHDRVAAAIKQKKALAASKLDEVFGVAHNNAPEIKNAGLRPVPLNTTPLEARVVAEVVEPESDFGLLNLTAEPEKISSAASPPISIPEPPPEIKKTGLRPDPLRTVPPGASNVPHLRCLPLIEGLASIKRIAGVPDEVYEQGNLEHPAINGLSLTMEQRLSPLHLEYTDESGEIIAENVEEKRFRVMWKKPIKRTISKTDDSFTDIDESLFKKK